MIVCHCTNITDHEIHAAIDWMRASDPATIITPGKVYHALGKSPDCGGCMSLFLDTMRKNDNLSVPAELRGLRRSNAGSNQPTATKEEIPCKATARSSTI
ncbi:(2Fe-2S)-binding protein [Maritalea mobilis]|uniref:(2Fe-2S)-binding protein n=1 Tax=[Roseibacterium] beibuensis TaxID=1193142 RepID=A0ABP9LH53_9RHOB|nr:MULTISPECIES: (2Fe-2S)-binding protein [Alphaproteobacteria]MBY6202806.1 (2Fe-2S)-binding protein [Maritalea mobilis]MCS6623636.1 (2Fe-2S)-binding protein [Roseibacterium beibuensis]